MVAAFTGFAMLFAGPLYGILRIYTLVMIVSAAVKSYRGECVEIALCAHFIK